MRSGLWSLLQQHSLDCISTAARGCSAATAGAASRWLSSSTSNAAKATAGAQGKPPQPSSKRDTPPSIWLASNHATPPVRLLQGMDSPTALSWLRRRGPDVPHGLLYKFFRKGVIRLYNPQTGSVSRVNRSRTLQEGEVLLFPKDVAPAIRTPAKQPSSQHSTAPVNDQPPLSPAATANLIIHKTADYVFVNKPAMVSVQESGPGSLQTLLVQAMGHSVADELRLVHRLDRQVSGLMLLARHADAAAWASACFRDKAAEGLQILEEQRIEARASLGLPPKPAPWILPDRESLPEGLSIFRSYLALVHGNLKEGPGRITLPVPLPGGGGPARPAISLYRVHASDGRLSLLELVPLTGRRHQLRYHCSKGLGTPIVGDAKYGFRGLQEGDLLHASRLTEEWWSMYKRHHEHQSDPSDTDMPILLHSRQLILRMPGKPALKLRAPLPSHMAAAVRAMGWGSVADS